MRIFRDLSPALPMLILAAVTFGATPSRADDRWHGGWHGSDMHHFRDHDEDMWHGGHWFHGVYGGRLGWWWIAGGNWYYYPQPVYPYPDPYLPPVVAPAPAAPPGAYWYYCSNPPGYYPYVPSCATNWVPVPAQPR